MKFYKLSATGNDFILFDNREGLLKGTERDFFKRICRRRLSVGADGILLIEESPVHDFSMRYFNSDGSLGEMCGNGARAAAYFAHHQKIARRHITFDVLGILYRAEITEHGVKLFMPPPVEMKFHPHVAEEPYLREGAYLNVGVPHFVLFTDDVDALDVIRLGRKYRHHASFQPQGTNTNFVQVLNERRMKIRTYERGVEDETLACGTGTISAAMTAFQQLGLKPPIEVETKGGMLLVDFNEDLTGLTLTGKARIVYEGVLREDG